MINPGEIIDNATLTRLFRVSNCGGIRRSVAANHLVLVADWTRTGGVANRWDGDVLRFVGQGKGDQVLERFNKALARSQVTHEDLHLFEVNEHGRYTYRGRAVLAGEPVFEEQLGDDGRPRRVIVFPIRLRTDADPDPLRILGTPRPVRTAAYLPAGAYAVFGPPPPGAEARLREIIAEARALGVAVTNQSVIDDEIYLNQQGRWMAAVDDHLRQAARARVQELKARAAREDRPWVFSTDDTDIPDDADDHRIEEVLDLLGIADEFPRMRDAAFAAAPPAPEPPRDSEPVEQPDVRDIIERHRRSRPR